MKIKRLTLIQQVLSILLVGFTVIFVAGSAVMRALQQSNLQYIYGQTQELVRSSVSDTEEQLADIDDTIYNLVVSDGIQEAGSQYLALLSQPNSLFAQNSWLDAITAAIQKRIIDNDLITCANYLDARGNVRAVASTGYIKLGEEAANLVEEKAIAADGRTILLDGSTLVDTGDQYLLFVKELREKKNLSMNHIGVIVLFIDMDEIGSALAQAYNGTYILENQRDSLLYLFNDIGGIEQNEEAFLRTDINRQGYALVEIGGTHYFVTEFDEGDTVFSYRVLLPYGSLFAKVERLFTRFVWIFVLCVLAALGSFGVSDAACNHGHP